ncbi:MAG TPA: hybrid sensor histidine kinase/response regulator [Pseudomonadales bacterium]
MDEANNLSVIFTTPDTDTVANPTVPRLPPLKNATTQQQLRDWIRNCNARIATIREQLRDESLPDARNAVLDLFPPNLHFPLGALIDFANRLGRCEHLELAKRIGLETQTIVSGILYLQQFVQKRVDSGLAPTEKPKAYSRAESETTWTCLSELILACSRQQQYAITLESDTQTLLPVPTLDIRLILQNLIFSVLNGSYSAEPIPIHVSNCERRAGQRDFCLSLRVTGNPLRSVIGTSLYNAVRQNHTFVFEGSGIGHILAAKLLEFLGGEIVITDHFDGTNTVSVVIPLDSQHQRGEARVAPQAARHAPGGDFSVLYIEDMQSHALLVQQIFSRMSNIDLRVETTAWAGLQHARKQQPDLILLDMELPDMQGLELYRHLQEDARTTHIPVVAISASAMPHQVQAALDAGLRHYITKPFSYKELIRILQDEQAAKRSAPKAS